MKKLKRKSLKIRKNIKEAALAAITAGSLSVVMELRRELSEFLIRRYRICVPDPNLSFYQTFMANAMEQVIRS